MRFRGAFQHRTTFLLLLNHGLNAATGIVFWLLFIHFVGLSPGGIGLGYSVVAVGTTIGLVATGGFGTALMRHVPLVGQEAGQRLLYLGIAAAAGLAVAGTAIIGQVAMATPWLDEISGLDWLLAGTIAALLVTVWLQDAFFLARGRPGATVWRNVAFSSAKLIMPLPLILLAAPSPVAGAWAASLVVATTVGFWMARGPSRPTPGARFFGSAWRNVLGNAAEFLPGLLLVPLVLMSAGAAAAGYFGMAWTTASLLFLAITAIGRSALTQMVRGAAVPGVVQRALLQASLVLVPGILLGITMAPTVLRIFGADYAASATTALIILCASAVLVLPTYLYLDVLRARELTLPLNAFPLTMMAMLFALAPWLTGKFGITGTAIAWFAANLPFSIWAAIRLFHVAKEVTPHAPPTHRGHPDLE